MLAAAGRLGAGMEALEAAEQASLLRVEGGRLEFRHPLIRSAVYHGAPMSRRHAAHLALASVLDGDADADRRAWHRAAACVEPDAEVVSELERTAGRARRRSGFVPASLAYERAAALAVEERRRVRLLIAAAENAWFAGRPERATMLLERALPLAAGPVERAEIDSWRALIEINAGVPADACELLVRSAPDMATVDGERALYLLSVACIAGGYSGDPGAVARVAALAERIPVADTPGGRFLARSCTARPRSSPSASTSPRRACGRRCELGDEADATLVPAARAAADRRRRGAVPRRRCRRGAAEPAAVGFARDAGALTLFTQAMPRLALTQIASGMAVGGRGARGGLQMARQIGQHQVVAHMRVRARAARGAARRRGGVPLAGRVSAEQPPHGGSRTSRTRRAGRWLVLELGRGRPEEALVHAREITTLPIALWSSLDRIEAAVRAGRGRGGGGVAGDADRVGGEQPRAVGAGRRAARPRAPAAVTTTRLRRPSRRRSRCKPDRAGRSIARARSSRSARTSGARRRRVEAREYLRVGARRLRGARRGGRGRSRARAGCAPAGRRRAGATRARSTS